MTFTEAAIEVLRREGKPLHFKKIAEIAAREDLLDHVGKIPEETMAGQLVAHCRLPKADRRVIAVQHGTFALVEWGLDEDPAGIENLVESPPVDELPYRSNERHPIPSREVARASGRGEGRARRREEGEEKRTRRFPPPSEVAYEILAGAAKALPLVEIASQGAERTLMPEAFVRDVGSLRAALIEDNRRRESAGRSALFNFDGDTVTLAAQPEPGERILASAPRAVPAGDLRKVALAALRKRMKDCDGPTFEHLAAALLERLGYLDLKVVKRGREHAVYTARKRLGAADVRHAIRIIRSHAEVARRDVQDLRRDVSNYGAQIGLVVATGEALREARGDASASGQLPVLLVCGDALAEAAAETGTACRAVIVPEVDEAFFLEAAARGAEEEAARRARREERDRREGREGRPGRRGDERRRDGEPRPEVEVAADAGDGTPEAEPPPEPESSGDGGPSIIEVRATIEEEPLPAQADSEGDDEDDDGDEDGPEGAAEDAAAGPRGPEGQPGAEGAEGRRRRRRRRRRRGGRGRREGAGAAPGLPGAPPAAGEAGESGAPGSADGAGTAGEAPAPSNPPSEPPPGGGEAPTT